MNKLRIALFVLLVSNASSAVELNGIHINRSTNGKVDQEIVLPFGESKSITLKEAWRSPVGIVCRASAFKQNAGLVKGTFECESKEGYKAQIRIDCSSNKSIETSAYLFFGLVGKFENIGNFYVWCE